MQPIIYWFRNDLRLHDNKALYEAIATGKPILPIYIFDENWITQKQMDFERCGANRLAFWENSVLAFKQQLIKMGGDLHIYRGNTTQILTTIYKQLNAQAIYAHHEYAPEEINIENTILANAALNLYWGNMLFAPDTIELTPSSSPFYYTAFKNKVTLLKNQFVETPTINNISFYNTSDKVVSAFKYNPNYNTSTIIKAGEHEALAAWQKYIQSTHLEHYGSRRELFEGEGFSTLLSPYLAMGAISPQYIYNTLNSVNCKNVSYEASIQKLKEQLIWRDYYRWLFLRYKSKIFRPTGLRTVTPPMFNDMEAFNRWRNGHTGEPLIDALMKELRITGFMSNRGRMITAYYLSKVLNVNWLWGAYWFENQLIDYEPCNNYGNWAYQSGTGTDSRINRRFNIEKQAQKFDASGHFRNKWNDLLLFKL